MRTLFLFLLCFFIAVMSAFAQETEPAPQTEQSTEPVAPSDAAMVFSLITSSKNCKDCAWVVAEGKIVPETPAAFEEFLKENPHMLTRKVMLHSADGDQLAAMALGRLFREKGFRTHVARMVKQEEEQQEKEAGFFHEAGYCANACVWAYLGGYGRTVEEGSAIKLKTYRPPLDEAGVVSSVEVATRKQQLAEIAYADDYAVEMGFDHTLSFVDWQNADLHHFTSEELASLNIVFDPDIFSSWALKPQAGGMVLEAKSSDQKRSVRFYCDQQARRYFEISVPGTLSKDALNGLDKAAASVSVFGKKTRLQKKIIASQDGMTILKIRLINFNPAALIPGRFTVSMDNTPKILAPFSRFELNDLASFKAMARFALRACISAH